MTTNAPSNIELWIDDDELAQIALSFERLISRTPTASPPARPTFFVDYFEVE